MGLRYVRRFRLVCLDFAMRKLGQKCPKFLGNKHALYKFKLGDKVNDRYRN